LATNLAVTVTAANFTGATAVMFGRTAADRRHGGQRDLDRRDFAA
jgi:hypothetical protein